MALWLCGLPSALAQANDWLVLPTTVDDETSWMEPTVAKVRRELRKQGIATWTPPEAIAQLEKHGPAPPATLNEDAINAWKAGAMDALRQLSLGEYDTTVDDLREAQEFTETAIETINRDPAYAQNAIDTCLFMVRALTESGRRAEANQQVQECARIAPTAEPTQYMHSPAVLKMHRKALGPNAARSRKLFVESDPLGCALRVNGVPAGTTPVQVADLYPGTYRVQVECQPDPPGRVHVVDLTRSDANLFVFDEFDRAVRVSPVLRLRYHEQPTTDRLARDARELGRMLPAAAVMLISAIDAATLELRLVTGAQMGRAWTRISKERSGPDASSVQDATVALLSGQCGDFTQGTPVMADCQTGEPLAVRVSPADLPRRPPQGQFISGLALASVGTASLLSGYGLLIARKKAGENWLTDSQSLDAQDKWLHTGTALIATGAAGSGLLVAAMPLVLPYRFRPPWWAWLSGGFGIAAAGASVALGVTAPPKRPEDCAISGPDPAQCVDRHRRTDLAIMLGATAAPLLTIPLVYLFRKGEKKIDPTITATVQAGQEGATVGVRGTF